MGTLASGQDPSHRSGLDDFLLFNENLIMKVYCDSILLNILRTALICSFVTAGFTVVGCDSAGSNEAEPVESTSPSDWTGKWKMTDPGAADAWATYLSRSEKRDVFKDVSGCGRQDWIVENISNGNVVKYSDLNGAVTTSWKYVLLTNGNLEQRAEDSNVVNTYEPVKENTSIEEVVGC